MDKMIIIPINLFNFEQEIIIVDQGINQSFAKIKLSQLPEVVVEACNTQSINNIKLIGNKTYAKTLVEEIKEYAIKNYANNKNLNISIMEV